MNKEIFSIAFHKISEMAHDFKAPPWILVAQTSLRMNISNEGQRDVLTYVLLCCTSLSDKEIETKEW